MATGKKAASIAGKGLRSKKTTTSQKIVDGSDLAQAKHKPIHKKKPKR